MAEHYFRKVKTRVRFPPSAPNMKTNNSKNAWNREYSRPDFITLDQKPQADFLKFLKWAKKSKFPLTGIRVIDAGCGTGRNSAYVSKKYGAEVSAFDFSREAITLAERDFSNPNIHFAVRGMDEKFPEENNSVDLVLDIMASFSLSAIDRQKFLSEINRVLRPGGIMYLRTLAKEGDKNAAYLIKNNPGSEQDTYIHPTLGSMERVFSEKALREQYSPFFEILFMEKKSGYQKFGNQSYKRNYWNVYLQKKG